MQENDSNQQSPSTPRKDISAWEQTLRWLDARWYSENKLREKLNKLHYPAAEIEDVIAKCREYNLVNDAALAEEFAKSQSSRGRGSHRIAFELRRHGLTGEAAENALNAIAGNEEEAASVKPSVLPMKRLNVLAGAFRRRTDTPYEQTTPVGFTLR